MGKISTLSHSKTGVTRYKLYELFFYGAYIIYLIISMLGSSLLGDHIGITNEFINTMKHVISALVIVSILTSKKFSYKSIYVIVAIGLASVMVYLNMGAFNPILTILFLLGCRRCDPKKISKIHLYCVSSLTIIIFASALLGIVENRNFTRIYDNTQRFGMGFRNSTWFGFIFYLFVDYLYIKSGGKGNRIKRQEYIAIIIIAIISYYLSRGRLEFMSTFILLIAMKHSDKLNNHKWIARILTLLFIIMFVLSFVTTYLYTSGNQVILTFDVMINSRLKFNSLGLSRYGISLFGNYVEMQGVSQTTSKNWWNYFYIDNFYISYIIQYGVIWMLLTIMFLTLVNVKLVSAKKYKMLVFMAVVALQGFVIPTMMDFVSSCTIMVGYIEMGTIKKIGVSSNKVNQKEINRQNMC